MPGPMLTGFAPAITFAENLVNSAPRLLDADVTFSNASGNFGGGSLTLSGLLAEDRASVRNEGLGAGQIGLSGSDVAFGGVVIGTLSGGVGTTLTITFNANATSAAIDALIDNLTYANTTDTPTASRDFMLNITDAAGADLGQAPGQPTFAPLTGAANPFDSIDFGDAIQPGFVDLDDDGDLDMVLGEVYGTFHAYENTAGVFTELLGASNPFDGLNVGNYAKSGFVDFDSDGDLDMVSGDFSGTLHSFRNDAGAYTELTGLANPFDAVRVAPEDWPTGVQTYPAFVDLDGDGDLDAVVGERYGSLRSFRNDAGVFTELAGTGNPFNGVDVGFTAAPSFVDLDGDGDLDAVVGTYHGLLLSFRNDAGAFTELTGAANPFDGVSIPIAQGMNPTFFDVNGDGALDVVVGMYSGTLQTYLNTTPHGQVITVNVTPEIEIINGTSDDNALAGTAESDEINGLDGNDTITGGTGDTVHGGNGDDQLIAAGADGFYYGDDGNDTLVRGADLSTMYGGDGIDLLDLRAYAGDYTVNMTMGLTSLATEIFNGFENVVMGNGSNFVVGTSDANTMIGGTNTDDLSGRDGNDILIGGAGNDTMNGDAGNDMLNGSAGIDRMVGGADNDTYVVDAGGDVIVEAAGEGTIDRVLAYVNYALAAGVEVEVLATSNAALTTAIKLNGNALAQTIAGNAGDNVLSSGAGGADRLYGFGGNDVYRVYNAGDMVFEAAGKGTDDRVVAYVDYALAAGAEVEVLATSNAALTTAINLTGNALAQRIVGNAGANILSSGATGATDILNGLGGNDTYRVYNAGDVIIEVAGGGTADRVEANVSFALAFDDNIEELATGNALGGAAINLTGNALAQSLIGNAGANRLNGLGGVDALTGGAGADVFVFTTALAGSLDQITDYNVAADRIEIDNAIFVALPIGALAVTAFTSNLTGAATSAAQRIIYEADTGLLWYDADGTGAGAGIRFADLAGGLTMTAAEFMVV